MPSDEVNVEYYDVARLNWPDVILIVFILITTAKVCVAIIVVVGDSNCVFDRPSLI